MIHVIVNHYEYESRVKSCIPTSLSGDPCCHVACLSSLQLSGMRLAFDFDKLRLPLALCFGASTQESFFSLMCPKGSHWTTSLQQGVQSKEGT